MTMPLHERTPKWYPKFQWVDTIEEAADMINKPHEDYPVRVNDTARVLKELIQNKAFPIQMSNYLFQRIHAEIFSDKDFAGEYRNIEVIVGGYRPTPPRLIDDSMKIIVMQSQYIADIQTLYNFYHNVESVHPFQDGNGRTFGVLVAAVSHMISPSNGYLAPLQ